MIFAAFCHAYKKNPNFETRKYPEKIQPAKILQDPPLNLKYKRRSFANIYQHKNL